ncbi:hypothetical protein VTK73DRAFT_5711 [Phialemonium thermophilum]|uniref:HMG box domain-containing protein n=1 Tax=Phialemonium thermophilum TaxID=223376 RepID=A0ABR3XXZ3_9PEZI
MTQPLENIFRELGISQYLDAFLDQGFDSWDTILDITESDLDVLGVKLGHRRKLQRRIANFRGIAPDASLVSPAPSTVEDQQRLEAHRQDVLKQEIRGSTPLIITKRKYRRHPKPDENAPMRPPSAYVLFSNKMREDLKGRNLTFTEIAKLVGEHWQNLSPSEKQPFESQAQAAKDKYNSDMAEYKRTPEYKKYSLYLQEFKAKHAYRVHDKDDNKRVKLNDIGNGAQDVRSRKGTPNRSSRSRSGSYSDGPLGSEPPPSRQLRTGSVASTKDSQYTGTPATYHMSMDDVIHSPASQPHERHSPDRSPTANTVLREIPSFGSFRGAIWEDEPRNIPGGAQRYLPSLSDMFEHRNPPSRSSLGGEVAGFPFPRSYGTGSPDPVPGLVGGEARSQTLKKEQSSTGSTSSGSSSLGHPRTPLDGPLPIHALLSSSKSSHPHESLAFYYGSHPSPDPKFHVLDIPANATPLPHSNDMASSLLSTGQNETKSSSSDGIPNQARDRFSVKLESSLDGMSALLKAGEIVDGRAR